MLQNASWKLPFCFILTIQNPVSTHTLASAARQILDDLCKHRDVEVPFTLTHFIKTFIKQEFQSQVRKSFSNAENFAKHADRDPEASLEFNPEVSEFTLIESIQRYEMLTVEKSPIMLLFSLWWQMLYRRFLLPTAVDRLHLLQNIPYAETERLRYFTEALPIVYRFHTEQQFRGLSDSEDHKSA